MKFMISWKISPGHLKASGERFLKSGAAMPEGLTLIGRWLAPGSVCGWVLVEGEDLNALYEHMAQWAEILDLQTSTVMEDDDAAQGLSRV